MGGPFRGIERKLSESTEITNFLFSFLSINVFTLELSNFYCSNRKRAIREKQEECNLVTEQRYKLLFFWQRIFKQIAVYQLKKSSISYLYSLFCVLRALCKLMRRPVLHINLNRKQFNKSSQTDAPLPHSQQKLTLVSKTTFHLLAPPETLLLTTHPNCETTLTH